MSEGRYNFSRDSGAMQIGVFVSKELNARIDLCCNITQMTRSSLCRYLLTRGIGDLETKLVELADRNDAKVAIKEASE